MFKIYNEDCLQTMKKINKAGGKVDLILTSPPYNTGRPTTSERARNENECRYDIHIDNLSSDDYCKWCVDIFNKIVKGGWLFFKCQDMTDGKFYCTHNEIINYATNNGYELKDIIIKKSKSKLQRDAKRQNCVAKIHSYWIVLKKNK